MRAILAGGDDYELCFTAAQECAAEIEALATTLDVALARVGRIVDGNAVSVFDMSGRPVPMQDGGFDHFR